MSETAKPQTTKRLHITREEEADRCLNHTTYSKGTAATIAAMFLLIVTGIPLAQHIVEIRQNLAKRANWDAKAGQPEPRILPQVYDVFSLLPSAEKVRTARGFWGLWSLIPSGESIGAFESSLKDHSILTEALLSPAQAVMSGWLDVGNEKAYCGQVGWLFYRPDVEYLTSDGFLDSNRLKQLARGATAIQPDPVKAILDLKTQLQSRGIQLIVMPMTTKPMIDAEQLAPGSGKAGSFQNPSFEKFESTLESNGIRVFDPTPILLEEKRESKQNQYLQTDTHWTPTGMQAVASHLARFVETNCSLPSVVAPKYVARHEQVSNLGDIAEMLKLPQNQTLYGKQQVTIQPISYPDGTPWSADRNADVLLLGDSFANIYSVGQMGWGSNAGLVEQLSYEMDRPIDKIVINDGGSFASRRELARQLVSGSDRLANKRVVVYEFSMRDLSQGDWKMIHFRSPLLIKPKEAIKIAPPVKMPTKKPNVPTPVKNTDLRKTTTKPLASVLASKKPAAKPANVTPPATGLIVSGRIISRAATPKPGSVPYKDCLIAIQLSDLKVVGGSVKGSNIVVYVWGMKDNLLVDSLFTVGQTLKLKLTPWASVESKYGGLNRQELESDDALSWAAYWGEVK